MSTTVDREKARAYQKTYRERHAEKIKARKDAWLAARPGYMTAAQARYRAKHPERVKADNDKKCPVKTRDGFLRRRYGITLDDYKRMFSDQGGVCAICNRPEVAMHQSGTRKTLSVDHCHRTGRVRGLLCESCNKALGLMKDDPSFLRSAADYLEKLT